MRAEKSVSMKNVTLYINYNKSKNNHFIQCFLSFIQYLHY